MTRRSRRRRLVIAAVMALAWIAPMPSAWAAPEITLEPSCKSPGEGGPVRVTGSGFTRGARLIITGITGGSEPVQADVNGNFVITLPWTPRSAGTYSVAASSAATLLGQAPTRVETTLGVRACTTPSDSTSSTSSSSSSSTSSSTSTTTSTSLPAGAVTLKCIPPIGPPGFVTLAVGTGFPPNAPVELTWQPGIAGAQTVSDADGNLSVQVLVMHRDMVGPRNLVARAGTAANSATASAPFLVVQATLGPPEVTGLQPQLVFRR